MAWLQDAEREARAAVERASAPLALSQLPLGMGMLTDSQLAARTRPLTERASSAAAARQAAEQQARRYARDGGGPAEKALQERRARLADQVRQIDVADAAARELQRALRLSGDARWRSSLEIDRFRDGSFCGSARSRRPPPGA
ncbi:hypothetical protein ACTMTF_34270 [Nonomuraea sp. ZG12]|uniref:hypothetical protein n=1 Tax=Nonomuraea sp. ZG12 TaxID=3452207 RepID=UPI003F8A0406